MKPYIRREGGAWVFHDGMLTRPASSWAEARRSLAARIATQCLNETCFAQRGINPYGVCDQHAPDPVDRIEIRRRTSALEKLYQLRTPRSERTAA